VAHAAENSIAETSLIFIFFPFPGCGDSWTERLNALAVALITGICDRFWLKKTSGKALFAPCPWLIGATS